jgi:cell division protein FtsI/penicillin-binding protein 2
MSKHANLRINIFLGVVVLISSLILYRLFILSVVRHSTYLRTAQAQSENINNVIARGNIYFLDKDHDSTLAATNKKFPLIHIIPDDVKPEDKERVIEAISSVSGIEREELVKKIGSGSSLKVIARRITDDQAEAVKNLKIKGVGVSYETDRFYPGGALAANVLGFLGYNPEGERSGQYGIEEYYDQDLFGKEPGLSGLFALPDPLGIVRYVSGFFHKEKKELPKAEFDHPSDVVLTIDKNIQNFAEEKLRETVDRLDAIGGSIIIQDPATGRILAMADWPGFDPNNYSRSESVSFLNSNTQKVYEPGSSYKPVTMASGLDLGKITPQMTFEDKGYIDIAGYTIHNFSDKVFGHQTMSQILEKSINTGTMYVENLVGDDNFLNYTINMGFGQKTGIDLPGEVSGDVTNLYSGRKINFLTASFGQGIAVTPIQLINAYSVIANGGKLMRPYLVDKIVKENGEEIVTKPEVVSIPISEKTASKLQSMLVSVVDNGFDKARIDGYDIAGKTGTAQIPDQQGGYVEGEFIHNFLGFAPAYNAKFVILIKVDKPQGITFAADSLSPVFKDMASFLINYYGIPPTRK